LLCAAIAILLRVRVASVATDGHNLTALVHMSPRDRLAAEARESDSSFWLVNRHAHYDGVYFYAIFAGPRNTPS
jgi:hypothetical protein